MCKINLIFMGGFTYPTGMAGTKRIQNAIKALNEYSKDIKIRVIIQRQSSEENVLSGVHEGTYYETIMGDLFRTKMFAMLPILYFKTIVALKNAFLTDHKNIIYFYGPIFYDSILPLSYAKRIGYKIVFDVNEDYDLGKELQESFYDNLRLKLTIQLSAFIIKLSSGIVAISSHLEKKYKTSTDGKIPIHYMPISVDMDYFQQNHIKDTSIISLCYAGTFGNKDGLPVLLDAFDTIAGRQKNIRLLLTGRGGKGAMKDFLTRLETSPYKERIIYKGYLTEKEYYSVLNTVDIPCMTRIDTAYSHAGFPFKLGEFLATGKPVIASRVSDVERYLTDKHNAMLVKPGSKVEICNALDFLIDNPKYAEDIGTRGREVAKSYFDYKKQGKPLFNFLLSI